MPLPYVFIKDTAGTLRSVSLVAWWPLDEASGTRVDVIGGNDLTDNNTVTQAAGLRGDAAQFTAANSESLSRADNADLSMGDIDFTFCIYVYPDTLPAGDMSLISKVNVGAGSFEYELNIAGATDKPEFFVSSDGGVINLASVLWGSAITSGAWHLVVAYHDATANVIGISVDGGAAVTAAWTQGVFNGTAAFYLGARGGAAQFLDARGDGCGLWKKVLSTTEISDLWNGGAGNDLMGVYQPMMDELVQSGA